MCTFTYILFCLSLFLLFLDTDSTEGDVSAKPAIYCLTEFATYMSRFGCRQFTILQYVYCKSVLTAAIRARLSGGLPSPTFYISTSAISPSPLSGNTDLR